MKWKLAYNVPVIMLSGFTAEHNPHYAPFSFCLTTKGKGGQYGISSSSLMACTVSYGCSQTVSSPFATLLMFCVNPNYFTRFGFAPCGKCEACKIAKKKENADRLIIESRYHEFNYFVTLTYAPEFYPEDESLNPKELRKYLKRLRERCGFMPRFFACGEYGDEDYTERAHYHLAIFSDKDIFNEILESWEFGNVDIKRLAPERCNYICGYVVKKMTKKDDARLDGRHPEFFASSRRPALGYQFLYDILTRMATSESFRSAMLSHAYPPYSVFIGGRKISLPRYVRDKLRHLYDENKDAQEIQKQEKKTKDASIHAQIKKNLQRMFGTEFVLGHETVLRDERNNLIKMAYEKRQKRKL